MKRMRNDDALQQHHTLPGVLNLLPYDVWVLIIAACDNKDTNNHASLHSFACVCQTSRSIARHVLRSLYRSHAMSNIIKYHRDHPVRAYHILLEIQVEKHINNHATLGPNYVKAIRMILAKYVCNQYTQNLLSTIFIGDTIDRETITPSYDMLYTDRLKWIDAVVTRYKERETMVYDTVRCITSTFERVIDTMRLNGRPYSTTRTSWREPVTLRLVTIHDLDNERDDIHMIHASHPSLPAPRYECHIAIPV